MVMISTSSSRRAREGREGWMEKWSVVRQKTRGGEALQYNFKVERVVPGDCSAFTGMAEGGGHGIWLKKTPSFPLMSLWRKAGITVLAIPVLLLDTMLLAWYSWY